MQRHTLISIIEKGNDTISSPGLITFVVGECGAFTFMLDTAPYRVAFIFDLVCGLRAAFSFLAFYIAVSILFLNNYSSVYTLLLYTLNSNNLKFFLQLVTYCSCTSIVLFMSCSCGQAAHFLPLGVVPAGPGFKSWLLL